MDTLHFKLGRANEVESFGPLIARAPGVFAEMPPPSVVTGVRLLRPETQRSATRSRTMRFPPIEYYLTEAVRIVGRGITLSAQNECIEQTLPFHHIPELNGSRDARGTCSASFDRTIKIAGTALVLPVSSPSMSHFIFEGLSHIASEMSDVQKVILTCSRQEYFEDVIHFLLGPHVEVLFRTPAKRAKECWAVERAYVPIYRFALHPAMMESVDKIVSACGQPQSDNGFIYISRRDVNRYRIMLNEDRIISRMSNLGFDVLELGNMPEAEVIKKFSTAKMVVGPIGAGLYNSIFSPPGTAVLALAAPNYLRSFLNQCGAFRGLDLGYCFGPDFLSFEPEQRGGNNDFVLDEDEVVEAAVALRSQILDRGPAAVQPQDPGGRPPLLTWKKEGLRSKAKLLLNGILSRVRN